MTNEVVRKENERKARAGVSGWARESTKMRSWSESRYRWKSGKKKAGGICSVLDALSSVL